ncbi:MAG: hypothetical protein AAF694_21205 [Bacteroidota bacterium]
MQKLSTDWFMEGTLDFEYKKYILLAYMQHVSKEFSEIRLYPSFAELIHHYKNLESFQEQSQNLIKKFPTALSMDDLQKMKLSYSPTVPSDERMKEIEDIIAYALPEFRKQLKEGKEIFEYIDDQIQIEPIGVTPLYHKEGYIFLRVEPRKSIKVFEYKVIFFENTDANFYGISFEYLDTFRLSLVNTYEGIKRKLIHSYNKLPNPATWLLHVINPFPEEAALLPVAKRKMLAYLK